MPSPTCALPRTLPPPSVPVVATTVWRAVVAAALETAAGLALLRRWHVSRHATLAVAGDDADHADHGTGRGVHTSHQAVGDRVRYSSRVVQRARAVLLGLRLVVVTERGRNFLTRLERAAGLIRKASTRHLVVDRVHLPLLGAVGRFSHVEMYSPEAAARPRRTPRRRGRPSTDHQLRLLAAEVVQIIDPTTDTGVRERPGRALNVLDVAVVLDRLGVDPACWTGADVVRHVDTWLVGRRMPSRYDPTKEYAPGALLDVARSSVAWWAWAARSSGLGDATGPRSGLEGWRAGRGERRRARQAARDELTATGGLEAAVVTSWADQIRATARRRTVESLHCALEGCPTTPTRPTRALWAVQNDGTAWCPAHRDHRR